MERILRGQRKTGPAGLWAVVAALAWLTPLGARAQTTVSANTGINLVATGPSSTDTGANAFAISSVSGPGASASASASAAGNIFVSSYSANGALSANSGADAGVSYRFQIGNLYGHALPLNASFSFTGTMSVEQPFVASSIPQFVSTPIFTYYLRTSGTPSELKMNYQEVWQNGMLRDAAAIGSGSMTTTWNIIPEISLGANIYQLSQGDFNFLSIGANLGGLSLGETLQLDLPTLAGLIETRVFELGLPSISLPAGLEVGLGFKSESTSVSNLSSGITFQGIGAASMVLSATSLANSGGAGTISSASVTGTLSGFSLSGADLANILANPDFQVDANGHLLIRNPSGGFEPVLVSTDGDTGGARTFTVSVPEPGPVLYLTFGLGLLLLARRRGGREGADA